ncbi:hypothetical protein LA345_40460 (plasmid) [Burkholderia vietnamiensis]|uniref:Lipoprotein n=1 Tax=Burkholderia vietnamiensis (strain G4 / LMG 22486) TaxID=269482 RepID=A4JU21_BURVG|nr:hypothetical protein Bcep1808_6887 [Burkholderia vietnamiensis G4]MCB4350068.1 hypothetical protein [Burkholderia vietnamiensis]
MKKVACASIVAPLLLGACCTPKEAPFPPDSVDMSAVIDRVKLELNRFQYTASSMKGVHGGPCTGGANAIVVIVPTQAELMLKAVSTNTIGGSAGAKIPAGHIVTVNPDFSGSYKTVGTHQITLNLDVQHDPNAAEIQTTIDAATKEIDAYRKAQKAIGGKDSISNARFAALIDNRTAEINENYKKLALSAPDHPRESGNVPSVKAPDTLPAVDRNLPTTPKALNGYPLATTLWTLREQLLHVDHTLTPCVKPEKLVAEINFEVQKDSKAELGVDILIVSVGASYEHNDDTTQHLAVTFDMSGSTQLLINNVDDQQ